MDIEIQSSQLLRGIQKLIEQVRAKAALYINVETSLLYWSIGNFINLELVKKNCAIYGAKIVATLSQQLEQIYGRGYSYSALTRMMKIAKPGMVY